jgi:hypothetical protein
MPAIHSRKTQHVMNAMLTVIRTVRIVANKDPGFFRMAAIILSLRFLFSPVRSIPFPPEEKRARSEAETRADANNNPNAPKPRAYVRPMPAMTDESNS